MISESLRACSVVVLPAHLSDEGEVAHPCDEAAVAEDLPGLHARGKAGSTRARTCLWDLLCSSFQSFQSDSPVWPRSRRCGMRDDEAGAQVAVVGDRAGLADGSPGAGLLPCLAVVAVPGERPADHDDQAGVGVDDHLVVGGISVVLLLRGDGVVARGDQGAVHDEHGVLGEPLAGSEHEHRPEAVDDTVRSRLRNLETAARAVASSGSCASKPRPAVPGLQRKATSIASQAARSLRCGSSAVV